MCFLAWLSRNDIRHSSIQVRKKAHKTRKQVWEKGIRLTNTSTTEKGRSSSLFCFRIALRRADESTANVTLMNLFNNTKERNQNPINHVASPFRLYFFWKMRKIPSLLCLRWSSFVRARKTFFFAPTTKVNFHESRCSDGYIPKVINLFQSIFTHKNYLGFMLGSERESGEGKERKTKGIFLSLFIVPRDPFWLFHSSCSSPGLKYSDECYDVFYLLRQSSDFSHNSIFLKTPARSIKWESNSTEICLSIAFNQDERARVIQFHCSSINVY